MTAAHLRGVIGICVLAWVFLGLWACSFEDTYGHRPRIARARPKRQPSPAELIRSLQSDQVNELEDRLAAWDDAIAHEIAAADRAALARRRV